MAEVKATDQIRVLAGTFPAAHGDQAKKLSDSLKAAKIDGFAVKPAKNMPGYIQVIAECKDKEAAEKLIKEAAGKKFKIVLAE